MHALHQTCTAPDEDAAAAAEGAESLIPPIGEALAAAADAGAHGTVGGLDVPAMDEVDNPEPPRGADPAGAPGVAIGCKFDSFCIADRLAKADLLCSTGPSKPSAKELATQRRADI